MSPIIKLLRKIKPHPGMYIREGSLSLLAEYLRGYHQALAEFDIPDVPADHSFLHGFRNFVAERYSVKISQSWENIILFQAASNKEALEIFWELLDEYLTQQGMSFD